MATRFADMAGAYTLGVATDDGLKRSIEQAARIGASIKVPKSAFESAARLGRVITQMNAAHAEGIRISDDYMRAEARRRAAPVITQEAVLALLEEARDAAIRERQAHRIMAATAVLAFISAVAAVLALFL